MAFLINNLFKNKNGLVIRMISISPSLFLLLLGLITLQTVANLFSVISIAPVLDVLLEKEIKDFSEISIYLMNFLNIKILNLGIVFSSFIFFLLTANLTSLIVQYAILKIKYRVVKHFMVDIHEKFFNAKYSFFSESNSGQLINSFQKEAEKLGDIFGALGRAISNTCQFLIYMLVPLLISIELSLIFLVLVFLFTGHLLYLNKIIYPLGVKNTITANNYVSYLQQTFDAAKLIISNARQKESLKSFKIKFDEHADVSVPFQTYLFAINLLFMPLGLSAALITVYWGFDSGLSLSLITMILFSFFRMMPLISAIYSARSEISGFTPAYEQISFLGKMADENKLIFGLKEFDSFNSLEIIDVSFSYDLKKNNLENINLNIKKGQTIAIIGESGSGKTTLIDLILNLYFPSSGKILLNNHPIKDFNLNFFKEKIALVSQESFLFNESIKENMLWSKPNCSEEEMWTAFKLANIDKFIKDLPNGLNSIVGDRGSRMSGGQRQRISLARALLKNPSLIILDEATSALDAESEELIQETIFSLTNKYTVIIVAHRISTIKNVDYLYVMNSGRIIEEGSYSSLKGKEDSYLNKMIKLQNN